MTDVFDAIDNAVSVADVERSDADDRSQIYCGIHGDKDSADLVDYSEKNVDRSDWKCHACKASGTDVVAYVAERDNLSMGEAASKIADDHGLDIDISNADTQVNKQKKKVRNCQEHVVSKAEDNRDSTWRHYSEDTLEDLRIGWYNEELHSQLRERYGDILSDAGVHGMMTGDKDGTWMIPHLNRRGKPELMTCRDPEPEDGPKYIQAGTSGAEYVDNDIYFATGQRSDTLVLTEGYPDAIAAYDEGFDVIAAGCGSWQGNLDRVAECASRYDTVLVVSDNDDTGRENRREIGDRITSLDGDDAPKVLSHAWDDDKPEGYDLDEWCSSNKGELEQLIEDADRHLLRRMQWSEEPETEFDKPERRREVLKIILSWDSDKKSSVIEQWSSTQDVNKGDLRESLQKARENSESGEPGEPSEPGEPGFEENEDSEREGVPDNQEDLLEDLEESDDSESIRMSGILASGLKIHTTFLEVSGSINPTETVQPVSFIEDEEGNRRVKRPENLLSKKRRELIRRAKDDDDPYELPVKLTSRQKQELDYWCLEVDDKEIIFDPEPSRDDPSTKTPDSGIVDYYKGKDTVDDDLFQQIRSYVSDHWYHFNEEWYDILAAWIIHTYFLQDLVVTPYIFFTGKKGTGKTQAQRVLDKLSYHSIRHEQSTPASVERCVSRSHATIHMDEMDDMSEEKRIRMIRTINSGYNHGATRMLVGDTDASAGEQSTVLHTYSAKTIAANGLHQFSDTVKSRAWIIDTTPKPDSVDIEDIRHPSPEKTERLQDLRNQLFWLSFDKREQILDSIDKAKETLSVNNRQKDKISAAYGIIRYFMGEDKALEIAEFLASQSALKSEDVSKTDKAFLRVMADKTDDNGIEMPLSDIADEINRKTGREDDDKFSVTPKGVGNRLREYGMIQDPEEHKPRRSDGTYAKIPAEIVREQMEVHGFSELASKVGHLSLTDDNDQESGSPGSLGSPGSPNSGDSLADNDLNRVQEAVEELCQTTTGASASHADVLRRCGSIDDKTIQDILENHDRFYEVEAGEWRVSQ